MTESSGMKKQQKHEKTTNKMIATPDAEGGAKRWFNKLEGKKTPINKNPNMTDT